MPTAEEVRDTVLAPVIDWYESKRASTGKVHTNVMAVGLIVTEYMAKGVPITTDAYRGDTQIKGISGGSIKKILAKHQEIRPFLREGGRTSRGSIVHADDLATMISDAAVAGGYHTLPADDQAVVRNALQEWFVERVRIDYFDRQRISAAIKPSSAVRVSIAALLDAARKRGGTTAGAVAQHLVGAKLALRFPDVAIDNHSYTTADHQLDRPGDFSIGDTAIHVTTSPTGALFDKCIQNIADGYRPLVLVPANKLAAGQQLAEISGIAAKTSVQTVEDFVGTNVEETAQFISARIRTQLRTLLEIYNERVGVAEIDPALLLKIPGNL